MSRTDPITVLVVDDDPSMLTALVNLLSAHDFIVKVFSSAEDFQDCAELSAADCLILDIHLSGISGIELHAQLLRSGHDIPVIFITGKDSEATGLAAMASGCVAYLTKPFFEETLIDALENALGRFPSGQMTAPRK